jgi:hypothetical protein
MSHVFISYSRKDQDYVSLLAQALESHRLPVWLDDHIDYGTTWPRVIQDHVERCAVFLVVMSPRSEDSLWVQNELTLAQKLKKPVFPLLLEGEHWFQILTIQSVDVVGGKLPPARFYDTLRPYFPAPTPTAESLPLQDVVEKSMPPESTPVRWVLPDPSGWVLPDLPTTSIKPIVALPAEDDLSSEKGVDYRKLRNLLRAGKWEAADRETERCMFQAVELKGNDRMPKEELLSFPCTDLRTIDALWVKYTTLRTDLGGCGSSLGGYNPVVQKRLVVGMGFNQSRLQTKHRCK